MIKFSITNELKTVGEIHKVSSEILQVIPENILFSKSKAELCEYVLNQFDFPEDSIKVSDVSGLEQGCKTILLLMGIDDNFETGLLIESGKKFADEIDRFLYYFLDFYGLPGNFKEQLETTVQSDLDIINKYITEYEKVEFIKNGEIPRNHSQRTQHDFYKRCLEEKAKIETHLSTGINDRALNKARRDNLWGMSEMMFAEFSDRPYRIPMPMSNEYFNNDKIDKVGHRLGEIPIQKGRELKQLYAKDKKEFYSELEKLIPEEKVLEVMLKEIEYLPFLVPQRKDVFKELIDLYKSKKWYGFYALALTQIEGLFTEMCKICDPNLNNPYAALPDKVNIVRPYHPYSENRFDYFQYHLPILRNRFLHFGLDGNEKIEILCKELLWDLEVVVSIFLELNVDALWMLRLIRRKGEGELSTYSGLCYYFDLVASLKKNKQLMYFKDELKNLNENDLPAAIFDVVYGLEEQICQLLEAINEPIKIQSGINGFKVDLETITFQEIADNKIAIKKVLKETFNWQLKSEIEELLLILHFLKSYRQNVDIALIQPEALSAIEEIEKKYGDLLTRIKLINLKINNT